jgi:hypothetical protein
LSEANTGSPSTVAGPSVVAANVSCRVGSRTTATAGLPPTTSAIETQKNGMPFA